MSHKLVLLSLASCVFANIRTDLGGEADLRALGESLKKRQHIPILVRSNGLVIDGERRIRAARLVGLMELWAVVTDEALTPEQIQDIQFESAFHRADLSVYDKAMFLVGKATDHPDWTNRQIAERVNIGESMVGRFLSIRNCIPAVQEAVKAGRIGVKCFHQLSLATPDEQPALLEEALTAASVEDVARQRRQRPAGTVSAVRTSNLRIERPTGNVITVKGDGLDLETIAEELTAAAKDARKALSEGFDAKTWSAMCRDRAKASV